MVIYKLQQYMNYENKFINFEGVVQWQINLNNIIAWLLLTVWLKLLKFVGYTAVLRKFIQTLKKVR